jgi:hypothetical protein
MSLKTMLMKKMIGSQMKGMPKDQQDAILAAVENNPELFQKISADIKAEMKNGKDQMAATFAVMPKYQEELKRAMGQKR